MKSISLNRLNSVLLLAILSVVILYFGKPFLVPLLFAIFFCMLLSPICDKLEKWGLGRIASTLIGMLIIILVIGGIISIIVGEADRISDDIPTMKTRAEEMVTSIQIWIEQKYNIDPKQQADYINKTLNNLSESGGRFFNDIVSWLMGMLTGFVLILLYFFFFMWKRDKYREFFLKLVYENNRKEAGQQLDKISRVSARYLIGRLISMIFLLIIYIIGFNAIGLPNAFLMALIAVLPTIIPYIGAFVGGFFPIAMSLIGGSPDLFWPTLIILAIAQAIDNNIIEPLAEGESMDMSPVFTIIAIVVGELIWGVAGMILFIPMFAILKIICDHIPALYPYSYLMANEIKEPKWVVKFKSLFKK